MKKATYRTRTGDLRFTKPLESTESIGETGKSESASRAEYKRDENDAQGGAILSDDAIEEAIAGEGNIPLEIRRAIAHHVRELLRMSERKRRAILDITADD